MKSKFIILSVLFILNISPSIGQIGIGTSNPQAAFHIDGSSNNPSSTPPSDIEVTDDFVFTEEGSLGLGTIAPLAALDINSTTGTFIPPRMSNSQRDNLTLPPKGAMIFNNENSRLQINTGTPEVPVWENLNIKSTQNSTVMRFHSVEQIGLNPSGLPKILFNTSLFDSTSGLITYNSNGDFLLKAGKTYKLEFGANWVRGDVSGAQYAQFRWFNNSTNTGIGAFQHLELTASAGYYSGGGLALAVVKPSTDITVSLRYIGGHAALRIGDLANGQAMPYVIITILD